MSVPYKKKPARIKDKLRKMWKRPGGGKKIGQFGTAGTGTISPIGSDGNVPFKKKPPRKGRPDGN